MPETPIPLNRNGDAFPPDAIRVTRTPIPLNFSVHETVGTPVAVRPEPTRTCTIPWCHQPLAAGSLIGCAAHAPGPVTREIYLLEFFAYETIGMPLTLWEEQERYWIGPRAWLAKHRARILGQIRTLATARSCSW